MKKNYLASLTLLTFGLLFFACNDTSIIGSDLLEDDQLGFEFTDTLTLKAKTVVVDSILAFASAGTQVSNDLETRRDQTRRYFLGDINDPVFGQHRASLYLNFELAIINGLVVPPNFVKDTTVIDSVLLVLPYNDDASYGNVEGEQFDFEIRRTDNDFDSELDYYSNAAITTITPPIEMNGSLVPSFDSISVEIPSGDTMSIVDRAAEARINLPISYFQDKFVDNANTENFEDNEAFQDLFEGIALIPQNTTPGLVAFDINPSISSGLQFFFHDDTMNYVYFFPVDAFTGSPSVRMNTIETDYTGAIVQEFIDGGINAGDSLLFLQDLTGLDIELEIPYSDFRSDIVVNKAELILPIIDIEGLSMSGLTEIPQLVVEEISDDGTRLVILDIVLNSQNAFSVYFGGDFEEGDLAYSLNITDHFQYMLDGSSSKTIRILPLSRAQNTTRVLNSTQAASAGRVVIGGPKNTNPIKLNLSYTIID